MTSDARAVDPTGLTTYRMTEAIIPESFSVRQFSPSRDVYLKEQVDAKFREVDALIDTLRRENRELREAVQSFLEIGKRDLSNPKYDGYFDSLRAALAASAEQEPGGTV